MMKLHGFPLSPNTRRACLMLEECGAPYELVPVDLMSGEHRGEAYRALNPTARVPVLVDGDFVLWESNAILEYLAALYPDKRMDGATPIERGEIARWMYMNAAHLSPNVARIFAHTIRLPLDLRIQRVAEEARSEVDRSLAPLDARLSGREFIMDRVTLADVAIAPTLANAEMLNIDLAPYPHVASWLNRLTARPSWKKVYA